MTIALANWQYLEEYLLAMPLILAVHKCIYFLFFFLRISYFHIPLSDYVINRMYKILHSCIRKKNKHWIWLKLYLWVFMMAGNHKCFPGLLIWAAWMILCFKRWCVGPWSATHSSWAWSRTVWIDVTHFSSSKCWGLSAYFTVCVGKVPGTAARSTISTAWFS